MKKLLVVLLALATTFAFAACGEQAEPAADEGITVIPVGDSLSFETEGAAYGKYVLIETPAFMEEEFSDCEIACYYAKGSDTPYIITYKYPNTGGTSIEEEFASNCAEQGVDYYQILDEGYLGAGKEGYCNYSWDLSAEDLDGDFFYVATMFTQDGDDFVAIDFLSSAEELALGNSGKYLWIPAGYESDASEEELSSYNAYLSASYDASYYMPYIFAGKVNSSYEGFEWFWGDSFPDGLPADKATYQSWVDSGWNDDAVDAYYKAIALDITRTGSKEVSGYTFNYVTGTHKEDDFVVNAADAYVNIDGTDYNIWISSKLDPIPAYAMYIYESLHTK